MANNIFIEFLPPWIETGLQPAFYDKESGTVLQQTARMYAKVNELVTSVNNQNETIEDYITQFNELHDYVYDYFENLDVQEEINKKLDQMMRTGELAELISSYVNAYVDPKIEAQNNNIAELQDLVHGLSSFAPIPVSSTSQMTDHNKVYVLTSSGNWYYWNSTTSDWAVGGTYQASSLGLGSVDFDNLTNNLSKSLYGFSYDVSKLGLIQLSTSLYNLSTPMLLKAGTTITVSNDFVTNYKWMLRRVDPSNELKLVSPTSTISPVSVIFGYSTDTSYTLTQDEYCVFCWMPIDDNWNTTDYTVDRRHRLTSSDITSILYFYPKRYNNSLIDLDYNQIVNSLFGSTKEGNSRYVLSQSRISTSVLWKSKYDIVINIKNSEDYDYGVTTWNVEGGDWTQIQDTGWKTTPTTVTAGTYFTLTFRKKDNSNIMDVTDIKSMIEMNSYADLKYVRDYVDSYEAGVATYNYIGENLDLQFKHGYEASTLFNTTLLTSSSQGFDIYNGYLVQLYNGGHLNILDMTDGSEVSSISNIGFQHGDAMQFSNEFYDPTDQFPLAYVTSDSNPGIMYVVRIKNLTSASIVKSYIFPEDIDGYFCGYVVDTDNNIVYSLGYKKRSFTDPEDNATIISVYNMNNETEIGDGRYTLELIERYEKPFIYCMQGMKFLNGIIYIVSSYQVSVQHTSLCTYDPVGKRFTTVFTDLPSDIELAETEDIAFIKGETKYEMVVGTRAKYMKFVFTK